MKTQKFWYKSSSNIYSLFSILAILDQPLLFPIQQSTGLKKLSGVKAPPLQSWRGTDMKNTSSSSSSLSSFNSSLSLSPAKGKLNTKLDLRSDGPRNYFVTGIGWIYAALSLIDDQTIKN
ncbi:hypothetical protein ATANTOWER_029808 [Ataeniobius toweri]|uniref:Uncharacterized protein n=1 Tax=Ataeniobius toweri TaxID=208326 RepID=A0ABU7B0Y8_9TELE|nr:hypothetical protein [Ataeniobius toweri]